MNRDFVLERHPWEPFVPKDARILIMGTFPPKPERWSMSFYYPNKINDFWRIMGLVFFGLKDRFWDESAGCFRLHDIRSFLEERGIALHDTGAQIRRLRDNASDKYLEIVEKVNLDSLLDRMPHCHAIATTGEKAASVIADLTGTAVPKMGEKVEAERPDKRILQIYRMPSTSRAYPLSIEKKAHFYAEMFREQHLL